MPFICLTAGFLFGIRQLSENVLKLVDSIINVALIVLMITIGINIGRNDSVIFNLGTIGFNCAVISISAIIMSIIAVITVEKTILPLEDLKEKLYLKNIHSINDVNTEKKKKKKHRPSFG